MMFAVHATLYLIITQLAFCMCQGSTFEQEAYRQRGQAIIRRISAASGTNHIRPVFIVEESPGIAHFDVRDRTITADPRLFRLADSISASPDVVLAYILGHEYAHYVRGHDFDYRYQHTFGEILEKGDLSNDLSNVLAGSRQKEFEADYYGMYFCYLAGYKFSLQELTSFMEGIKNTFGDGTDYAFTHPAWSSRKLVVETVLKEFEQRAFAHYAALCLMRNGFYDEAASIYDWVNSTVAIADMQWNELVARILIAQSALNRKIVSEENLFGTAKLKTAYRGNNAASYTKLDADVNLDKAESLIHLLRSHVNPLESLSSVDSLLQFLRTTATCAACNDTRYCQEHERLSKTLNLKWVGSVPKPALGITNADIAAKVKSVRSKLKALGKYTESSATDLRKYEMKIRTTADQSRLSGVVEICQDYQCKTITMLIESCPTCSTSELFLKESLMYLQTEGQKLFFSIETTD